MTITWTSTTATIGQLKPWAQNPRYSTKVQAKRLLESWKALGQFQTIAVGPAWDVYDGHQRLSALLTVYGLDYCIDVRQSDRALTDDERRKLVITAHVGAVGGWDWDKLSAWDTSDLREWGMDADALKTWNADVGQLTAMLESEKPAPVEDAEPAIDRADELRVKWGIETGQLWQLGEHRLICGDCTDRAVVERVMGGERADMAFTDPPYGVDYHGGHFHSGDVNIVRKREKLAGDEDASIYGRFLPVAVQFVDGPLYIWFADRVAGPVYQAVDAVGASVHALIIWNKTNATYAAMNAQYKQRHEPCLYIRPSGSTLRWSGPSNECTVWDIKRDSQNEFHPTQKPVELAERAISNHIASTVADFFLGSGTTLIACERLGRKCRAIEISPAYVAVALERWTLETGKKPKRLS